jgi:hypothetical protein
MKRAVSARPVTARRMRRPKISQILRGLERYVNRWPPELQCSPSMEIANATGPTDPTGI